MLRAAADSEAGEYAKAGLDLRQVSTATGIDEPKVSRKRMAKVDSGLHRRPRGWWKSIVNSSSLEASGSLWCGDRSLEY